jgi:transposase
MSNLIAALAQNMPHDKVSKLLGIPWVTVGSVARRVAERLLPGDRMDGLKRIAVDEFYWAKKQFITVVWDHDRSRVVWIGDGKSEDTLAAFFTELGLERCEAIEIVTGDMGAAYLKAVGNHLPNAHFVLDHFHVLRLAHNAVDEVRRESVRELRGDDHVEEARAVKNSRYTLLTNPTNLDKRGTSKIEDIRRSYHKLYRAWSMKEALAYALTYRSVPVATRELKRITKWMKLSRLQPFKRLGKTLSTHLDKILNSIRYQLSNGPLEGCNRKIRGLIYRAFGYRSRDNFVGAIYLNCSGVQVPNPLAAQPFTLL